MDRKTVVVLSDGAGYPQIARALGQQGIGVCRALSLAHLAAITHQIQADGIVVDEDAGFGDRERLLEFLGGREVRARTVFLKTLDLKSLPKGDSWPMEAPPEGWQSAL